MVAASGFVACSMASVSFAARSPVLNAPPPTSAEQRVQHRLIRRLVVFPFEAPVEHAVSAQDAWWQTREELTRSPRFLVASKQYVVKSDNFIARGTLEPADVILLGKLLDAHAIVTGRLDGRKLAMKAYDSSNGVLLWRQDYQLHPSIAIQDQLPSAARKVIADFIASVPYQAFQIVDPLIGAAMYEEGNLKLAQIDVGISGGAQINDPVQWIRIDSESFKPLFQGGARIDAFAEGKIVKIERGIATVEMMRMEKGSSIREYDLVRLPREYDRLQQQFAIQEGLRSSPAPGLLAPEAAPMEAMIKERRPLAAVISWVASVAAFLLLAF